MLTTQRPEYNSTRDQPFCGCGDFFFGEASWPGSARKQDDFRLESLQPKTISCYEADSGDGGVCWALRYTLLCRHRLVVVSA